MKFLLDESVEYRLAAFLQGRGHDVTAIAKDYPASLADHDVLDLARQEQRIVVTNDLDFGELIFHQQQAHSGVILFRLVEQDIAVKQQWLSRVLHAYADQLDPFLVITRRGVRVRRSPEGHVPQDG